MPHRIAVPGILVRNLQSHPFLVVDIALGGVLLFLPNLVMGANFLRGAHAHHQAALFIDAIDDAALALWTGTNLLLGAAFITLRRTLLRPLGKTVGFLYGVLSQCNVHRDDPASGMRAFAGDVARMAQLAQEYYSKHQDAQRMLSEARELLAQINVQQRTVLDATRREMMAQYQSVLTYAHYLEEQIALRALDPSLRYDFDDISESSFNLKLIAGAFELIAEETPPEPVVVDMAGLIQQTMLALAPSLDRRSMQLTTANVDLEVRARGDGAILVHVLWMLLLGTIRYAADESTLRLGCSYDMAGRRALLSVVVSELAPGRLTEDERGAHLLRQMQEFTPHMFAETIRIQANLQLAALLMARLAGDIEILPLTHQSCEIRLSLPTDEPSAS